MYKYKVGDKVIVRSDLRAGTSYDGCLAVTDMLQYAGQVVTIARRFTQYSMRYGIKEDDGWYWSDDMFQGLLDEHETVPVEQSALLEVLNA